MPDLLLTNVRPMGGATTDMLIRDGVIAQIGQIAPPPGIATEDGHGAIAVARSDRRPYPSGQDHLGHGLVSREQPRGRPAAACIDFERENRLEIGIDPHRQSMRHAIGLAAHGASHIRSHVDIDPTHGLRLVEGVQETREKLRSIIDIEIVAFPQSGVMVAPRHGTNCWTRRLPMAAEVLGGHRPLRRSTATPRASWMRSSRWP
jgi:cytosine deaminase